MAKKTLPDFIPPMKGESARAPFDSPDWIFEIKLGGYRAVTVFEELLPTEAGSRVKKCGVVKLGAFVHHASTFVQ